MTIRRYRAKRSKFLTIAGVSAIPYGLHVSTSPSAMFQESLLWLPSWFDASEVGIIWLVAGILAMTAGVINYAPSTRHARRSYMEMCAFSGLMIAGIVSLVIQLASWLFFDTQSLGATAWGFSFILFTINASTWDNPKTIEHLNELDLTHAVQTGSLPVMREMEGE